MKRHRRAERRRVLGGRDDVLPADGPGRSPGRVRERDARPRGDDAGAPARVGGARPARAAGQGRRSGAHLRPGRSVARPLDRCRSRSSRRTSRSSRSRSRRCSRPTPEGAGTRRRGRCGSRRRRLAAARRAEAQRGDADRAWLPARRALRAQIWQRPPRTPTSAVAPRGSGFASVDLRRRRAVRGRAHRGGRTGSSEGPRPDVMTAAPVTGAAEPRASSVPGEQRRAARRLGARRRSIRGVRAARGEPQGSGCRRHDRASRDPSAAPQAARGAVDAPRSGNPAPQPSGRARSSTNEAVAASGVDGRRPLLLSMAATHPARGAVAGHGVRDRALPRRAARGHEAAGLRDRVRRVRGQPLALRPEGRHAAQPRRTARSD